MITNKLDYLVDPNKFEDVKEIKKGGFSTLYLVKNKDTGNYMAAKIINHHNKKAINREIAFSIKCSGHSGFNKFYGFSKTDFFKNNDVTLFMEFQKNGSLADILRKTPNTLDNTNRQIILLGVANGISFLHKQDIAHRDLKPENILLDENKYSKIIDFGTGKYLYNDYQLITQTAQIGTLKYMPPEYLRDGLFVKKSDVFSYGMIMYEIVTGIKPYKELEGKEMNIMSFTNKVVEEDLRPKFPDNINKSLKKLICKCWSKDINERPSFDDIIKILAFNIDDSITDFYDDEEEENEETTSTYCLDDIDIKKYKNYIENDLGMKTVRTVVDDENSKYEELSRKINNLEQEINSLKHKNKILMKENRRIKNVNEEILKELKEVPNQNDVEELKIESKQLKKDYENIKHKYHRIKEISLKIINRLSNQKMHYKDLKNYIENWQFEMMSIKQGHDNKLEKMNTEINSLKNNQQIGTKKNIAQKPPIKRGKSVQSTPKTSNIIEYKIQQKSSQSIIIKKPTTVSIPYKPSMNLYGIIDYLNNKSNGIVSLNGVVQVTCSSTQPNCLFSVHDCKCLCNFKDLSSKSMWTPNNERNGYVQFDFVKNYVNVSFYTLQTPTSETLDYPKSWEVKCSNNLKEWTTIDKQLDQECMNTNNVCNTFKCQNYCSKFFRYVRIVNIDECWNKSSRYYFDISAVEFYGEIKFN